MNAYILHVYIGLLTQEDPPQVPPKGLKTVAARRICCQPPGCVFDNPLGAGFGRGQLGFLHPDSTRSPYKVQSAVRRLGSMISLILSSRVLLDDRRGSSAGLKSTSYLTPQ